MTKYDNDDSKDSHLYIQKDSRFSIKRQKHVGKGDVFIQGDKYGYHYYF